MIEIHYQQNNHPKPNQPWLPSVHGIVLNKRKAILIHQREDNPLWALPGGKLNLNESLVDCLKREMIEETGLEVTPERLLGVFSSPEYLLSVKKKVFQPLLIVFLCHTTNRKPKLNAESLSFAWLDKNNIGNYKTFPLMKDIARLAWNEKERVFFDEISLKM